MVKKVEPYKAPVLRFPILTSFRLDILGTSTRTFFFGPFHQGEYLDYLTFFNSTANCDFILSMALVDNKHGDPQAVSPDLRMLFAVGGETRQLAVSQRIGGDWRTLRVIMQETSGNNSDGYISLRTR